MAELHRRRRSARFRRTSIQRTVFPGGRMKNDSIRRYPQLSRRGERILLALLEHPSQEKAAAAAGISTVTLWRWQKKPGFRKALAEARRDVYSQAMARIHQASAPPAPPLRPAMLE